MIHIIDGCQRCGEKVPDLRTLRLSCLVDFSETLIPFTLDDGVYKLVICKDCRGDFICILQHWFNKKPEWIVAIEKLRWEI